MVRNKKKIFSTLEQSLILGLLVTYFVHNIIVFDNLISYIAFFTLFAYVITKAESKDLEIKHKKDSQKSIATFWTITLASTVLVAGIMYFVVVKPHDLNESIINMYKVSSNGDEATIKNAAAAMLAPALYGMPEANEQLLTLSSGVIRSNLPDSTKQDIYSLTEGVFKNNIVTDPLNPRPAALYASYLEQLGMHKESLAYYDYASKLTPKKVMLLGSYAQATASAGDFEGAQELALRAYTLAPRSIDTAYLLASIKHFSGKDAEVPAIWQKTIELNKGSQEALLKEILYYKKIGNQKEAAAAADRFAEKFPELKSEIQVFLEQKEQ